MGGSGPLSQPRVDRRVLGVPRSVGVSFELQQVSSWKDDDPDPGTSDLTRKQREAIVTALEAGYFDVPRETTLKSIADSIDISDTAVSYRLRRGLRTVLEDSIDSTGEPEEPPSPDDARSWPASSTSGV
jgi:hypothetical protein